MAGRADALPGPLRRPARWLWRLFDPHARAIKQAQRMFPGQLLQPAGETRDDRHPALFGALQRQLAAIPALRLLSFGCSTGEEAFTLKRYFPQATIDAVDLNPRSIALARERMVRDGLGGISFTCLGEPPVTEPAYHAILCLSVLRHGDLDADRPASCVQTLPFARFDAVLAALDAALLPGGFLLLWGSNFRFTDAAIAPRYQECPVAGSAPETGAFYGSDNQLLALASNASYLFQKLG